MYRVLIADDEEIERKALRKKLINNVEGIEVCTLVEDGKELLDAVKKYRPDIIIVDIEMPVMNGLEAIRKIREENLMEHGKILVYTAYGQFSYAQEALQSKVDDYILKPASIKKLVETVKKCMAELDRDKEELEKYAQTEKMLGNVKSKVAAEFVNAVSIPNVNEEQGRLFQYVLGDHFMKGYVAAFSVKPKEKDLSVEAYREAERGLLEVIKESGGIPDVWKSHELYCFVPAEDGTALKKISSNKKIQDILAKADTNPDVKIKAGIGNFGEGHSQLHQSFLESFKALHFVKVKEQVVHIQDLIETSEKNPFLNELDQLAERIKNGQLEDYKDHIQLCFLQVRNHELHEIKEKLMEAVMRIVSMVSERVENKEKYSLYALCEQMLVIKDREALKQWYWDLLVDIEKDIDQFYKDSPNYWVQCAMDYISDHYSQDISLASVAEAIGVNSFYLSHIFSEVTGENYSSYLSRYRIEKACKLLEGYDYSMNELAEKVGFNSVNYFSKVFKKKMGCSLSEYKKQR